MPSVLNRYQQCEAFLLLAREHQLDAGGDSLRGWWIGCKRYHDPLSVVVALITAFEKVGLSIPAELRDRPCDL